jgi:replicative DNA helicase
MKNQHVTSSKTSIGRMPPQALEVEKAVLGAMLIESGCISRGLSRIKVADVFYSKAHQLVFSAILHLFNESRPVDLLTATQQLRKMDSLETIGGAFYLATLTETVNSAANLDEHVLIVYQQYVRRELIRVTAYALDRAYDDTADVLGLLEHTQMQFVGLTNVIAQMQVQRMGDLIKPALDEVGAAMKKPNGITGVPSGISVIDRITGGWQPSDLIIIAARPSMGKTTYVLNVLKNAALNNGLPVAIFSLEMSSIQLTKKVIGMQAGMTTNQLVKGVLEMQEYAHLESESAKLLSLPLYVDDTAGITVEQIRAKTIALKAKHDIRLAVVDYLQLVQAPGRGSREQEISAISRGLKMLAKDLNIPVIALSQLSRAVESRPDKRPQLSDLRESGAIEQDADLVGFLYRPEYYGIKTDEQGRPTANVIELIVSKHRNGALADVRLKHDLAHSRVHDWEDFKPQVDQEADDPF